MNKRQKKQLKKWIMTACLIIVCGGGLLTLYSPEDTDPTMDFSNFVTLTDSVPDVILEIRYYGTYNFVGQHIKGYHEPTALVTKQTAWALRAVKTYQTR